MSKKVLTADLVAVDTSENFTISALVPVVLLDGVLLERLAARVAREEHHDDFSRFHDIHFAHVLFTCAWTQLRPAHACAK